MKPPSAVWLFCLSILFATACGETELSPMLVLASKMEGTLVDKDLRPVPNTRVERTWQWGWNGKTGSDFSTTNAQGHFEFPKVTRFSVLAVALPVQPVVTIHINAHGPGGLVNLYSRVKMDYANNSEMDGKPLNIVCRIDLEPGPQLGEHWGTVIEVR